MGWVKIPKEHFPLIEAALPKDPRIATVKMFGGLGAMVNGNMFGGLWAKSVMVRLSPGDQKKAQDIGAVPFDPLGNGRTMADSFVLPDNIIGETRELERWLQRALDFTSTLPPKKKKPSSSRASSPSKPSPSKRSPSKAAKEKPAKAAKKRR